MAIHENRFAHSLCKLLPRTRARTWQRSSRTEGLSKVTAIRGKIKNRKSESKLLEGLTCSNHSPLNISIQIDRVGSGWVGNRKRHKYEIKLDFSVVGRKLQHARKQHQKILKLHRGTQNSKIHIALQTPIWGPTHVQRPCQMTPGHLVDKHLEFYIRVSEHPRVVCVPSQTEMDECLRKCAHFN